VGDYPPMDLPLPKAKVRPAALSTYNCVIAIIIIIIISYFDALNSWFCEYAEHVMGMMCNCSRYNFCCCVFHIWRQ